MITFELKPQRLEKKLFIVKVFYEDPVTNEKIPGVDCLLETKLSVGQVYSILSDNCKDTYKFSITFVPGKKWPGGYHESYSIDSVACYVSRTRFVKTSVVETPQVILVKKTITKEL